MTQLKSLYDTIPLSELYEVSLGEVITIIGPKRIGGKGGFIRTDIGFRDSNDLTIYLRKDGRVCAGLRDHHHTEDFDERHIIIVRSPEKLEQRLALIPTKDELNLKTNEQKVEHWINIQGLSKKDWEKTPFWQRRAPNIAEVILHYIQPEYRGGLKY